MEHALLVLQAPTRQQLVLSHARFVTRTTTAHPMLLWTRRRVLPVRLILSLSQEAATLSSVFVCLDLSRPQRTMRALSAQKDTTTTLQIDTSAHCAGVACILQQRVLLASRHAKSVLPARGRLLGVPAAILVLITPTLSQVHRRKQIVSATQGSLEKTEQRVYFAEKTSTRQVLDLQSAKSAQKTRYLQVGVVSACVEVGTQDPLSLVLYAPQASIKVLQGLRCVQAAL